MHTQICVPRAVVVVVVVVWRGEVLAEGSVSWWCHDVAHHWQCKLLQLGLWTTETSCL